jgi:hypothetical protein
LARPFAKSDVEKLVQHEAGNNRQPIKAAFDILERLGMIRTVNASVMYPKYVQVTQDKSPKCFI